MGKCAKNPCVIFGGFSFVSAYLLAFIHHITVVQMGAWKLKTDPFNLSYVRLSVCLSVSLSVCLSVCLFVLPLWKEKRWYFSVLVLGCCYVCNYTNFFCKNNFSFLSFSSKPWQFYENFILNNTLKYLLR